MADGLVRTRTGVPSTDPYGLGVGRFGAIPEEPPTTVAAPSGLLRTTTSLNRPTRQPDVFDLPEEDVPDTGLPGSPLNTLYGVDSESYLTDDQRKLARQIQGKFDQSVGFRDRELQRYGAPRLASFTEDESLARAMALARGLNFPEKPEETPVVQPPIRVSTPLPKPSPSSGPPPPPPTVPKDRYAEWAKVMSGLMSIAGLLFGKDAYQGFINKGAIKSVQDWIKGITGTDYSPEQLETMVKTYGAGSGWGQDVMNPLNPYGTAGMQNLPDPSSVLGGGGGSSLNINDFSDFYGDTGAITTPYDFGTPVTGVPDITDIPWWEM